MATIDTMLRRFEALDIEQEAANIVESHPAQIIGFNQANLYEGKYKQGDFLAPYKNIAYARKKLELNPAGVTDLKYTGEYYKSLFLAVDRKTFTIKSDDPKDTRLTALYGEDIKGISDGDKVEFGNTVVQPGIVDYIRRETGCK